VSDPPKSLGNRKFYSTVGYIVLAVGLGFTALLLDKVDGSEFLQVLLYTGSVVTAYNGLNVAKEAIVRRKE